MGGIGVAKRCAGGGAARVGLGVLAAAAAILFAGVTRAADPPVCRVTMPDVVLRGIPFACRIEVSGLELPATVVLRQASPPDGSPAWTFSDPRAAHADARSSSLTLNLEATELTLAEVRLEAGGEPLQLQCQGQLLEVAPPRVLPGWLSILPPLLAIGLALITRQVHVSLLLGVGLGAWILQGWNPMAAFMRLGDRFLVDALADRSHASIILFSTLLGGMIGVLTQAGATEGIVQRLAGRIRGRRQGQLTAAVMGTVIFFDDYANTLLVGNSMRPLTDKLRISREKLAYIVDSTAAPITTVAVISTWVGFEVGLIQEAIARAGDSQSAYSFFLRSIPYCFYPWLTVWFVYLVAGLGRDFGSMFQAEERAVSTGQLLRPGAQPASDTASFETQSQHERPAHPLLAIVPIGLVILATGAGLWYDGAQKLAAAGQAHASLRQIVNEADSFAVLMWAALAGALAAIFLCCLARRLNLREAVDAWMAGAKAMLIAMVILILAWSLSGVCAELHTADYLVAACRGALRAHYLPSVSFILSAVIGFATGTSWGTMAILIPLIFPLGAGLPAIEGLSGGLAQSIHLAAVSAVLAGAVFGDHCSPISDTTIMSSLASGSDHIDHVRTQLPYAALVALVAILCGYLPVGFGLAPGFGLFAGACLLLGWLLWRGRRVQGRPA
jgi:Na+/H+ antiporter NhaC